MKNPLVEIYYGLKSLLVGMAITLREFFKPIVTVQYPHQTLKIPARFRGHIELVSDPQTGKAKCFVCKLCERACPSDCITVEGMKPEGAKRKTVTTYRLDFTKCSLCGSCVEACRDGAIRFSREYNLAGTSKEEFIMDLFTRLEAQRLEAEQAEAGSTGGAAAPAGNVPTAPAKPEPPKPAPTQPEAAKPAAPRGEALSAEAK
jgi:NADH-quinone oxidoreductase subunit I